jgi:glycosyltransferase involved in cell wall biosynthesis
MILFKIHDLVSIAVIVGAVTAFIGLVSVRMLASISTLDLLRESFVMLSLQTSLLILFHTLGSYSILFEILIIIMTPILWYKLNLISSKDIIKSLKTIQNRFALVSHQITGSLFPKTLHEGVSQRAQELAKHETFSELSHSSTTSRQPLKLAYILLEFPKLSETFILEEISALHRRGHDIRVYTIAPAKEDIVHQKADLFIDKVVGKSLPLFSVTFIRSFLYYLWTKPLTLLHSCWTIFYYGISAPIRMLKLFAVLPRVLYLTQKISKSEVNGLHSHFARVPGIFTYIASLFTGLPYTISVHGIDIHTHNPFASIILRNSQAIIAPSNYSKAIIEKKYGEKIFAKTIVMRCGIDFSLFSNKPQHRKIFNEERGNILAIGRLVPVKGFEYLIEAARIIKKRGAKFHLKIIGDGPLKPELIQQASDLAEIVEFMGALKQRDVRNMLEWASILVVPSIVSDDGQVDIIPLVISEALAMEIPIIGSDVGGIPELVFPDINGFLVPQKDPDGLANAIQTLLEDREKLLELKMNTRALARKYSDIEKNVRILELKFAELYLN